MSALRRFKDRVRPQWFKAVRKWVGSRAKLALLTRRFGLMPLSGNPLKPYRRNDTVFILGGGASINRISPEQWEEIRRADSIGISNWHLHEFVPDFYVTEPGKELDRVALEFANIEKRGYGHAEVPILLKDCERYRKAEIEGMLKSIPASLHSRIRLSWDWEIHDQRPEFFRHKLRWLDRTGLLTADAVPILRKRASVFYLVVLALRAGYKNVVLCGVDLDGGDYFYEAYRAEREAEGYWVPPKLPPVSSHKTNDKAFGELTIADALAILKDEVLDRRAIGLYVGFGSSRLHPMLPAWFDR